MKSIYSVRSGLVNLRCLALTLLFPLIASVSYSQTLVYRETFGNAGPQTSLASQGITDWTEMYTMTGASAAADNNLYPMASYGSTSYVNVGPATGTASTYYQGNYGVYKVQPKYNANTAALSFYTSALTLNPTSNSYTFEWYQSNQTAASSVHMLLQVGGSWYASATSFVTAPSTITLESYTYNPTAANWLLLSSGANPVNSGVTNYDGNFLLTTPAPSDLSGNITAFGLLLIDGASNPGVLSIDNFSVYSSPIPEPTSFALIAGCAAGFALLGMRRKRS